MKKLLVAMSLLVACGGYASVSSDEFPQSYRDAFCRNFVKCGAVKDLGTCRKLNFGQDIHVAASGQAAFVMGKADFNSGNAQACVVAIANADCDLTSESERPLISGALPEPCQQ